MMERKNLTNFAAAIAMVMMLPVAAVAQTNSPGEALVFDGINQYVNLGSSSSFNAYPLTIMAWIKTTSTNLCGIVNKYVSGSFNGYQLLLNNGHLQAWYFNSSGGGTYYNKGAMDGGLVNDGQWHHIALSVDVSGGRLFKDGVEVDNEIWTGTPSAPNTSQSLEIGYYPGVPVGIGTGYYTGEIDEVSLWNAGMYASQIQIYMNRSLTGYEPNLIGYWRLDEGSGTTTADDSGNGNAGTLVGGPTWTVSTAPIGITAPTGYSQQWTTIPDPLPTQFWQGIASSADGTKLAGTVYNYGIYTSTNSGATWQETSAPPLSWLGICSSADGSKLVAGSSQSLQISTNSGASWFPAIVPTNNEWLETACSADGTRMFAGSLDSGGLWMSSDTGSNWAKVLSGPYLGYIACSSDGMKAAVAGINSIYTSTNGGTNWNLSGASTNLDWYDLASSADGNKLLSAIFVYQSSSNYLYLSTNAGATWQPVAFSNTWNYVAMSADGSKMLATPGTGTIYISDDSGATWQASNVGADEWEEIATSADGSRSVAVAVNNDVATSLMPPSLEIARVGSTETISWPSPSTGFMLRQRTNLVTGSWSLVTTRPNVTNSQNQVITTATKENFYLLEFP